MIVNLSSCPELQLLRGPKVLHDFPHQASSVGKAGGNYKGVGF